MESDSMVYRSLGKSGLKVSVLSYGNMTTHDNEEAEQSHFEMTDRCVRAGINFFDTAQMYGYGGAETILGKNLKTGGWDLDDLIITTKLLPMCGKMYGNSRKRLRKGMVDSLERMQLDHVDVIYLHRPDHEVPLEEQVRAMNQIIDDDLAYYWGTSQFTPQSLLEIHQICEKYGLIPPIVEQVGYSMLERKQVESDLVHLFDNQGLGTTVWSPLAMGLLTGKYNDGIIPEDSRFKRNPITAQFYEKNIGCRPDKGVSMLQGLAKIAQEIGVSQSQLALGWVIKNPDVSTAIFGATNLEQLESNLGAVEAMKKLDEPILARIEELLANRPEPSMNWRIFTPNPPRR